MKLQRLIPVFVSALLLLSSCGKKDTSTAPTYKSPSIASHTNITVPAGLSAQANSDYNAAIAVSFLTIANGMSSFASDFTVPEGATKQNLKSNGTVYFWTYGGYSYWMTYQALSDKYTWKYEWQTPDVTRFTFITAEEAKSGNSGNWKIYNPEASSTTDLMWDFSWTLAGVVYNATMNWYEENGTLTGKFMVLDNGNNSGNFKYFEGDLKKIDIIWNSDGTGSWWISDDGVTATASGTWTAVSGK